MNYALWITQFAAALAYAALSSFASAAVAGDDHAGAKQAASHNGWRHDHSAGWSTRELVKGVPLRGSANGMHFDADDRLYVANAFGGTISILDPESGEILDQLGAGEGPVFPDDLAFAPDGTLYWTEPILGNVFRMSPNGEVTAVVTGFPGANPITLSDDGQRVFFAQCFQPTGGIYEVNFTDPEEPFPIIENIPDCASNAMDWRDGALYGPRWFEGRIVRTGVDVDRGTVTDVSTGWFAPAAVKFDSEGRLHAVSQGTGEVVRIDLEAKDLSNNRKVIASLPIGLDNLAFDSHDRLFVSSSTDAFVVEILTHGKIRVVSRGGMNIPMSMAVLGNRVIVGELQSLREFNTGNGHRRRTTRSVFGIGPLTGIPFTTAVLGRNLLLIDSSTGVISIFDPRRRTGEDIAVPFALPVDAEPFMQGIAVTEVGTGSVVLAHGDGFAERTTLFVGLFLPTGLAARGDDLYVADAAQGGVFQIVRDGEILVAAEPVSSEVLGFVEGITLRDKNTLVAVDGSTGQLKEVNLKNGDVKTIAEGLGFRTDLPPPPSFFPWGFLNDVEVDRRGALYVNGDGANVIYKIQKRRRKGRHDD